MWRLLLAVFWYLPSVTGAETFSVAVPKGPVTSRIGDSPTLPCWLSPAVSAEQMEVRWYRPRGFSNPVLLYRSQEVQQVGPRYKGRVSLGSRGPEAGGLQGGDVSLRLENVTVQDAGEYLCYVSSSQHYEHSGVNLSVNVLGLPPVMWVVPSHGGEWNLSCESSGWWPQPDLVWMDQAMGTLRQKGLRYTQDEQGLVSASSWILAPPTASDWFSCVVYVPGDGRREGRIRIADYEDTSAKWMFAFIFVIFLLLLLLAAIAALFLWKKMKDQSVKDQSVKRDSADPESVCLLPTVTDWEEIKALEVDIKLDSANPHEHLTTTEDGKKVRDKRDCALRSLNEAMCVLSRQCFSSDRKYWEVGLGTTEIGVKESWAVGVADKSGNGVMGQYWALSLNNGNWCVPKMAPSDPWVTLPAAHRPHTLGVLLDYDGGKLSFYDAERKEMILQISCKFTHPVYALFNPGVGDTAPITLSSRPADASGDADANANVQAVPTQALQFG